MRESTSSVDDVMMYAVTYVNVEKDTAVDIGVASDDGIQVLLDGEEIQSSLPRRRGSRRALPGVWARHAAG